MAKQKLSVFLSYAEGDVSAAQMLRNQLADEGWLDVWFKNERLEIGEDIHLQIEKAIHTADLAIICISKDATKQSGLFHKQLGMLLNKAQEIPDGAIFIIPLKLEECEPPFVLRELHFANYFENNREKVYPNILRSLQKRANELKINTAVKPTSKHTDDAAGTPNTPSMGIGIQGNASNSAVVSGDHNEIHVTNHHYYNQKPENTDEN